MSCRLVALNGTGLLFRWGRSCCEARGEESGCILEACGGDAYSTAGGEALTLMSDLAYDVRREWLGLVRVSVVLLRE